jgi:hypothetical protein
MLFPVPSIRAVIASTSAALLLAGVTAACGGTVSNDPPIPTKPDESATAACNQSPPCSFDGGEVFLVSCPTGAPCTSVCNNTSFCCKSNAPTCTDDEVRVDNDGVCPNGWPCARSPNLCEPKTRCATIPKGGACGSSETEVARARTASALPECPNGQMCRVVNQYGRAFLCQSSAPVPLDCSMPLACDDGDKPYGSCSGPSCPPMMCPTANCYERGICDRRIFCAKPLPLLPTSTSYAICLQPRAQPADLRTTLRFRALSRLARNDFSLTLDPLRSSARTLSSSELVNQQSASQGPLVNGRFRHPIGSLRVDGAANPTSGRDIQFINLVNEGPLASGVLGCSNIQGNITEPINASFNATCIYVGNVQDGTPFDVAQDGSSIKIGGSVNRVVTEADFVCP